MAIVRPGVNFTALYVCTRQGEKKKSKINQYIMFYGVSVHNHVHIKRIVLKRDLTKAPTFIAL